MPRIIKSAKGSFTAATITVDGSGRVIAAADGSAGGKGFVYATGAANNETVTYTASPLATGDIYGARVGGGGGGGQGSGSGGAKGGRGGFGVFFGGSPSGPYNNTDAVAGAAGTFVAGANNQGNSGSASSFGNLATGNGGQGGFFNNTAGNPGSFSTNLTSLSNFSSPTGVGVFGGFNIGPNKVPAQNPTSITIANLFPNMSRGLRNLGEGGLGTPGNGTGYDGAHGAVVIFEGQ